MTALRRPCRPRFPIGPLAPAAMFSCLAVASCGGDPPVTPIDPKPEPDRPTVLAIHAGDGQTATAGTSVAEPVLVRVTGRTGAALAGVQVGFAVTAGGGRVRSASASTGTDGLASPGSWTLGTPGPQELRATVEGLQPVTFTADAIGIPARVEAAAGLDQQAFVGSQVAVAPQVRVTAADGSPVPGVPVSFTTDPGATIAGADSVTNDDGRASAGSWTLGPTPAVYRLEARVEGEGVTGNPVRFEARAMAGPPAELVRVEGDGQESEVTFPVPVLPRVRVLDPSGNFMAGVKVSFEAGGGSAVRPQEAESDSLGFAGVERWILGTEPGVVYTLSASVRDGEEVLASAAFTATATPPVYDIEIVFRRPEELSESHRTAFENAERLWEEAITGNLPWATLREGELRTCLSRGGIDLEADGDRIVNDMLIYASIEQIDGGGGILAAAGPCQLRARSELPIVGTLRIDAADADGEHLEETIVHEMAHVLGFGTLWGRLDLLQDSVVSGRGNPHFTGDSAVAAFARIGGERYAASDLVPVQNLGGVGVWNGHWRDFVFCNELMTAFVDAGKNPLSIVTLASMTDLGYEGVDLAVADEFTVPVGCSSPDAGGARRDVARPGGAWPGARPGSGVEILLPPIGVVNVDARRRVLRPR